MDVKRFMRLKQPVSISDIRYEENVLFLKEVPGSVIPMDTFVLMCYALCAGKDRGVHANAMYDVGNYQAQKTLSQLVGQDILPVSPSNMELMLQPVRMSGFGDISIIRFEMHQNKFVFKVRSMFAEEYKKLFSLSKEPVDLFLAGLIAGCISYFLKQEYAVKETACVVQGKEFCVFEASPRKDANKRDKKQKKTIES